MVKLGNLQNCGVHDGTKERVLNLNFLNQRHQALSCDFPKKRYSANLTPFSMQTPKSYITIITDQQIPVGIHSVSKTPAMRGEWSSDRNLGHSTWSCWFGVRFGQRNVSYSVHCAWTITWRLFYLYVSENHGWSQGDRKIYAWLKKFFLIGFRFQ